MPKGIGVIRWDNQLGPYLEAIYPENITLTSPEIVNIYTSQTLGDIATPRFTSLGTDEFKIVTYFGGMEDQSILILFLERFEDPDDFRDELIHAFSSMPKEGSLIRKWVLQIFDNLKKVRPKGEVGAHLKKRLSSILIKIDHQKINTLIPEFDLHDGITYPQLESIADITQLEIKRLLEQLANMGYLIREIYDSLIICPDCNSARLQLKLVCPICKSYSLEKTLITEHFICGTKTLSKKFLTHQGLICPKCNIPLKTDGVDYSNIGFFLYCHECRNFFNKPNHLLLCHNCNCKFSEENSNIINLIRYKVNRDKIDKFIENPEDSGLKMVN